MKSKINTSSPTYLSIISVGYKLSVCIDVRLIAGIKLVGPILYDVLYF